MGSNAPASRALEAGCFCGLLAPYQRLVDDLDPPTISGHFESDGLQLAITFNWEVLLKSGQQKWKAIYNGPFVSAHKGSW